MLEVLFAWIIGLAMAVLIAPTAEPSGPIPFLGTVVLLCLAAWAAGTWIPLGPRLWGVPWAVMFAGSVFLALVLFAARRGEEYGSTPDHSGRGHVRADRTATVLLWLVLLTTLLAVAFGGV